MVGVLLPDLRAEMQHGLADYLQQSNGPISAPIFDIVFEMTLRVTAFVLVGSPLCHNPTFLAVLKAYPTAIDAVSRQFDSCPPCLQSFLALVSKPLAQMRQMQAKMESLLTPIVQRERFDTAEATFDGIMLEELKERGKVEPFNMLSVLIQRSSGSTASTRTIRLQLMFLSLVVLFVSAVSTTQVMLQLVARPGWASQIRKEIEHADRANYMRTGLNIGDMNKMHVLDAFIKESIQMNMPGWCKLLLTSSSRQSNQHFFISLMFWY